MCHCLRIMASYSWIQTPDTFKVGIGYNMGLIPLSPDVLVHRRGACRRKRQGGRTRSTRAEAGHNNVLLKVSEECASAHGDRAFSEKKF